MNSPFLPHTHTLSLSLDQYFFLTRTKETAVKWVCTVPYVPYLKSSIDKYRHWPLLRRVVGKVCLWSLLDHMSISSIRFQTSIIWLGPRWSNLVKPCCWSPTQCRVYSQPVSVTCARHSGLTLGSVCKPYPQALAEVYNQCSLYNSLYLHGGW